MILPLRIYYEDTDCGGVVYYANYLKFFERGRTELLRALGISLTKLRDEGVVFVVTKAEIEYLSPSKYDDELLLDTGIAGMTGATITFSHSIKAKGEAKERVKGIVTLAATRIDGRPTRVPEEVRRLKRGG